MIPVVRAPEPASFESTVRQPGLDVIAELVGEPRSRPRRGPRRRATFASREQIPADKFLDLWREVIPDLREAYGNLCAYLALYIHHATGSASVDHFVPKAKDWRLIYEWSNYRLCCSLINGIKGDRDVPLDPLAIEAGLFALELTAYQVIPGPAAQGPTLDMVKETITRLGLNQRECCKAREAYVEDYRRGAEAGGIDLSRLERHAPFVARELRRHGMLVPPDV